MINLTCQSELVAKCISDCDLNETVKNAVILSLTSKVMQTFINSYAFFEAYAQVIDSGHFLPKLNQTLCSFKDRCFDLRGLCITKNENFSGIIYRMSPLVARSEKYRAVNDLSNSCICIFTPDGKECLSKYEVNGVITQIAIQENQLFIVEKDNSESIVKVFNLQPTLAICYSMHAFPSDSPISICLGKEYWAYSVSNQDESQTIFNYYSGGDCSFIGDKSKGESYLFSKGNDFIKVIFRDSLVCDIVKISFAEDRLQQTMIKEGIQMPIDFQGRHRDVCIHDDRLIVAYEYNGKKTKFFTYDIVLKKTDKLTSVDWIGGGIGGHLFKPRFLCVAQDIYYLITWLSNQGTLKSNLSTFTFSKI